MCSRRTSPTTGGPDIFACSGAPAVGDRGRSRRLVATAMPAQPSHPSAPYAPDIVGIVGWAVLRAVGSVRLAGFGWAAESGLDWE